MMHRLDDARERPHAALEVGEQVQERREALGYNKTEAAHRASMSWHTWNAIERGYGNVSLRNLEKAADAFGMVLSIEIQEKE